MEPYSKSLLACKIKHWKIPFSWLYVIKFLTGFILVLMGWWAVLIDLHSSVLLPPALVFISCYKRCFKIKQLWSEEERIKIICITPGKYAGEIKCTKPTFLNLKIEQHKIVDVLRASVRFWGLHHGSKPMFSNKASIVVPPKGRIRLWK